MVGPFPRSLLLNLLFLSIGVVCLATPTVQAEPADAFQGILVLRNGNVLEGQLQRQKDHYRVVMPNGQLQVPVAQVEMVCQSLDEAYEQRRQSRTGSTADSHIELASWSLRHRLYDHASRELQDARAIDPHHRKLELLERRLRQTQQVSEHEKKRPVVTTDSVSSQPLAKLQSAQAVPKMARTGFVRQIQPLLLRSCAASGCHQSGSSRKFELNQLATEGVGHPQATLGNLASVLEQVDRQAPAESALLVHARTSHGANNKNVSKPLSPRQLHILQAWVTQVAMPDQQDINHRLRLSVSDDPFDPAKFNRHYRR